MERNILNLVAMDRMDIPLSSLDNKLRRRRMGAAKDIAEAMNGSFESERAFAYVETEDKKVARGMKEAITEFQQEYPTEGAVLQEKIKEKRLQREKHLYFGTNNNARLTGDDYLTVMKNLGVSEHRAHMLYPTLMDVSRDLAARNNRNNRIVVGKYRVDEE